MRFLVAFAWCCLVGVSVSAEPEIRQITFTPQGEIQPALRYQFLPPQIELKPGNAPIFYARAAMLRPDSPQAIAQANEKMNDWDELRASELPLDEVRGFVEGHRGLYRELDDAARRRDCDWQLEERMQAETIGLLLPELQNYRELARWLKLKAKLEIAEGRFDEAARTMQTGFAMAHHLANGPTLIHSLVGLAINAIFCNVAEDFIRQPGAPNLYWALATLPQPFTDLRGPLSGEMRFQEGLAPPLDRLEGGPLSNEEANLLLEGTFAKLQELGRDMGARGMVPQLGLAAYVAFSFTEAKESLLASGMTPEEIGAMPAAQVVLLSSARRFHQARDDYFKWTVLPYDEARVWMEQAEVQLKTWVSEAQQSGDIPLVMLSLVLPALHKVHESVTRIDRQIQILRVTEAIRMYAAANEGKLPQSLDEITRVPVPDDPLFGEPFRYERDGDKAMLIAPARGGEDPQPGNSIYLELSVAK